MKVFEEPCRLLLPEFLRILEELLLDSNVDYLDYIKEITRPKKIPPARSIPYCITLTETFELARSPRIQVYFEYET